MRPCQSRPHRGPHRFCLILAFLAGLASGHEPAADDAARDAKIRQVQDRIVAGFTRGDAGGLAAVFSQRMKTYVACRGLGTEDGYYGADQMRLLLQRFFRGRTTIRFELLEPEARPRPDGLAVASALWVYREPGSPSAAIRLSFTLAPEADTWRVREIRDLK